MSHSFLKITDDSCFRLDFWLYRQRVATCSMFLSKLCACIIIIISYFFSQGWFDNWLLANCSIDTSRHPGRSFALLQPEIQLMSAEACRVHTFCGAPSLEERSTRARVLNLTSARVDCDVCINICGRQQWVFSQPSAHTRTSFNILRRYATDPLF